MRTANRRRSTILLKKSQRLPVYKSMTCRFEYRSLPRKELLLKKGVIYTQNTMDGEVLDANTEFLIGSVTKVFTVLTLVILSGLGMLCLDDPVDQYVKSKFDDFSRITIRDIINHKAGLVRDGEKFPSRYPNASKAFNAQYTGSILTLRIGTFSYSNIGYMLLGKIIEEVTGKTYISAFRQYIFDPLRMQHTRPGPSSLTTYHKWKPLTDEEILYTYSTGTAGSLHSTIADLCRFANGVWTLLNKTEIKEFKSLYICEKIKDQIQIYHNGGIRGGESVFKAFYDSRTLELLRVKISLKASSDGID